VAGADVVVGSNTLARTYGFAVAFTQAGEDDFLTIQNPNGVGADVAIDYFAFDGLHVRSFTIAPNSRYTVQVWDSLAGVGERFPGSEDGVGVTLTSSQPVLVEKIAYAAFTNVQGATSTLGYSPPAGAF